MPETSIIHPSPFLNQSYYQNSHASLMAAGGYPGEVEQNARPTTPCRYMHDLFLAAYSDEDEDGFHLTRDEKAPLHILLLEITLAETVDLDLLLEYLTTDLTRPDPTPDIMYRPGLDSGPIPLSTLRRNV